MTTTHPERQQNFRAVVDAVLYTLHVIEGFGYGMTGMAESGCVEPITMLLPTLFYSQW